jgi:hypothetical protein
MSATGDHVKLPMICLVLSMQLTGCIPIGIRGTSVVDAGSQRPAVSVPSGESGTIDRARRAPEPRRA